jgi:glycerate kinase
LRIDKLFMPLKVLIAPDKFKGTLSAAEAAAAIARGWREVRPEDELDLLPMSDGGDGFGEVISALLRAKPQTVKTEDAAHRPCEATWWWEAKTKTAIVESAKVIGLAMLPPGKFHPFELDTFGLGAVLRAAQDKDAKQILVGIGGSATTDGGFGLARALEWRFVDNRGHPVERWTELHRLSCVHASELRPFENVTVAVDVQNPLLGPRGATRVYGPQKGLRPDDFDLAERCLGKLANVMAREFKRDFAQVPGAGAAGGLGFGLLAFLGATLEPGFELFAKLARLEQRLRKVELVITGEGAIDDSTLMGKGVGQIARRCAVLKTSCIGLAGSVSPDCRRDKLFAQARALTELTNLAEAKANPAQWLAKLAAEAATAM